MQVPDIDQAPPEPPASPRGIFFAIVFCWVLFGLTPTWIAGGAGAGAWGDQFGAVNALFSGLALGGLLWTIWQQRREIWLTQQQLRLLKQDQVAARELQALASVLSATQQFLDDATRAIDLGVARSDEGQEMGGRKAREVFRGVRRQCFVGISARLPEGMFDSIFDLFPAAEGESDGDENGD